MNINLNHLWMIEPDNLKKVMGKIKEAHSTGRNRTDGVMAVVGGVAVIDVFGIMDKHVSYYGVSTERVRAAVLEAVGDKSVQTIMMRIDSPGGSVDGLAELGDTIFAARKEKQIVAQVHGMAASAGYYIASQATSIVAHRMDLIGSIGTTATIYDYSELFAKEGIEAVVIDTGEFKSAGVLGAKLTENQRAEFQRIVDGYFDDFVKVIARGRGVAESKIRAMADGRVFFAKEALEMGLIDSIEESDTTLNSLVFAVQDAQRVRTRMAIDRNKIAIS